MWYVFLGGWGGGNSQGKQMAKLFQVSRKECYHQLHSSGSTELPIVKVKHLCKRLIFSPNLLYNAGQNLYKINNYTWWLFCIWFEMYFSNLATQQYACGFLATASMRQKWIIHCNSAKIENKAGPITVIEEWKCPVKTSVAHLFPLYEGLTFSVILKCNNFTDRHIKAYKMSEKF